MSKKTKVLIVVIILILLALGYMWVSKLMRERDQAQRLAEAAEAEMAGLIVAEQDSQKALSDALSEQDNLQDQLNELRKTVPSTKVKEVIRWRTKEIEVPVEKIVRLPGETKTVYRDREVPGELPDIIFAVRGSEARLASAYDNVFAIGSVELWRVEPPPEEMLGQSDWQADVTDLLVLDQDYTTSTLFQVYLGVSSSPSARLGATWTRPGRSWGYWVSVDRHFDRPPDQCFEARGYNYRSGNRIECFRHQFDEWTGGAGVIWSYGR